jgi:hypothetical protein
MGRTKVGLRYVRRKGQENSEIYSGLIEGEINANTETAKKAIELGKLSFEEIAAICNLTLEEVQELASQV